MTNTEKLESLARLYVNSTDRVFQNLIRDAATHTFNLIFSEVGTLTPEEVEAGQKEGKIAAIRAIRDRTQLGLKEAKEMVENYFIKHGLKFYLRNGSTF